MKLRALLLLVGLLTTTAGCGTIFNLTDNNPKPYGGVRYDLAYLNNLQEMKGLGSGQILQQAIYDLAATCVLDTVSLPYVVVRMAVIAHTRKESPADDYGYLSRDHSTATSTPAR